MTIHYISGTKKSYRGVYVVLSQSGKRHMFQNRSGQVWKAEGLPDNIPTTARGIYPAIALYGLKGDKPVPLNSVAKALGSLGGYSMIFFLISGKLHIRWGDTLYRVKWRRSSMKEVDLLREFG